MEARGKTKSEETAKETQANRRQGGASRNVTPTDRLSLKFITPNVFTTHNTFYLGLHLSVFPAYVTENSIKELVAEWNYYKKHNTLKLDNNTRTDKHLKEYSWDFFPIKYT